MVPSLAAIVFLPLPSSLLAQEQDNQYLAQSTKGPVWCLDVKRNHVRRLPAWRCKGKVVSEEEAKRIKVSRFQRIRRTVNAPTKKLFPRLRQRGSGTGFFVSKTGHVLTNEHVIKSCKAYSVSPSGGAALAAKLIAKDANLDLAILKVARAPGAVARFRQPLNLLPAEPIAERMIHNRRQPILIPKFPRVLAYSLTAACDIEGSRTGRVILGLFST